MSKNITNLDTQKNVYRDVFFVLLAIGTIYITFYFSSFLSGSYLRLQKTLLNVFGLSFSLFFLSRVRIRVSLRNLLRSTVRELKQVTWPNRQETVQSTLLVLGVVGVVGFFLWMLDALLFKIVAYLTKVN